MLLGRIVSSNLKHDKLVITIPFSDLQPFSSPSDRIHIDFHILQCVILRLLAMVDGYVLYCIVYCHVLE